MKEALSQDKIRSFVRETYGNVATSAGRCCEPVETPSCCGGSIGSPTEKLGYSPLEIAAVPDGSNLGLGCGNPTAIASLKAGETVVDLGSGAGFDCFLAARAVGPTGSVIGVDMTPAMITKSRENAVKGGFNHVQFRLGEIEHLPIADNTVDIIISNCVINLSPDKKSVLKEAFRVLKSAGRLAISDIVATEEMPPEIREDAGLLCGCMSGAAPVEDFRRMLREAGFAEIEIVENPASREFIKEWAPNRGVERYLVSAIIKAIKP